MDPQDSVDDEEIKEDDQDVAEETAAVEDVRLSLKSDL